MLIGLNDNYYAIVEYYDDDDFNNDRKWLSLVKTREEFCQLILNFEESQPFTGLHISAIYYRYEKRKGRK